MLHHHSSRTPRFPALADEMSYPVMPPAEGITVLGAIGFSPRVDEVRFSATLGALLGWKFDMPVTLGDFVGRVHAEDRLQVGAAFARLSADRPSIDVAFRFAMPGGRLVSVRLLGQLLAGSDHQHLSALLTEPAEPDHRHSLAARDELISALAHELDHRLGNLLPLVLTIVRMTARADDSSLVAREDLEQRLRVLMLSDRLARRGASESDLRRIVEAELEPFRQPATAVSIGGHRATGAIEVVQVFALIVHELISNACKHGALRASGGTISATIRHTGRSVRSLRFRWRERSHGPIEPPHRSGFGTNLIARNGRSALGGSAQLRFCDNGLDYTLDLPLDRDARLPG